MLAPNTSERKRDRELQMRYKSIEVFSGLQEEIFFTNH